MNLDRRAQTQAISMSAAAQVLGFGAALLLTSANPQSATTAQLGLAAVYTLLSTGMSLRIAQQWQALRQNAA